MLRPLQRMQLQPPMQRQPMQLKPMQLQRQQHMRHQPHMPPQVTPQASQQLGHTAQSLASQQAQSAVLLSEKLVYESSVSSKRENEGSRIFSLKFSLQRGDRNKSAQYGWMSFLC